MALGSARAPTVAAAASPAAIMLTCLQDTQARLRRIETKQGQMQSSLEELRELVKKTQVTNFKVKGSPFQRPLECKIAELFAKDITRNVTAEEFRGAVASVLRNNTQERYMVDAALKHCKAFLCTLKGEERRKVFGKRPYENAPLLPTAELAALIVRQYHLTDDQVALYTKHVALLKKFIREATGSLSQDLHRKFAAWVDEKGLRSPTEEQWGVIMDEDSRCSLENSTVTQEDSQTDVEDDGLTEVPTPETTVHVMSEGSISSLTAADIRSLFA